MTKRLLQTYLQDPGVYIHFMILGAALIVGVLNYDHWMLAAFVGGWISYVVQEHLVHRYIFHAPAPKNQFWFNALYRLHYGHHDQVHNVHLLFTPLWFSIGLGIANIAVMALFLPLPHAIVFVYGGGVMSYLVFEWMHLLSHFNAPNRGPVALWVTRRHARHHFIDYENWFTVSPGGQWVDQALGASPDHPEKAPNVRTCGLEPDDPRLIQARVQFGSDMSLRGVGLA